MTPKRQWLAVVAVLVLVVGTAAAASVLTVSSGVSYETDSGLIVTANTEHEIGYDNPFDSSNSVTVNNVTFTATGPAEVSADQFTGTETQLSDINATTNEITIDPADKGSVTVGGGISGISFKDVGVDDSSIDFTYTASSSGTVEVETDVTNQPIVAVTGDGVVDATTTGNSGSAVLSLGPSASATAVALQSNAEPTVSNATPDGTAVTDPGDVTLSVDVTDRELQYSGTDVTVEFVNGSGASVGSETLTSNGTASTTVSPVGGTNRWQAKVSDGDNSVTTDVFEYQIPATLTIRDVITEKVIDEESNQAQVEFIGSGDSVAIRTSSSGKIDMEGLPADERFVVSVDAGANYSTRAAIIPSVLEQQTVYLLPRDGSVDTVEPRITLNDPTGRFNERRSEITLLRPLNISGETQYKAVAGDRVGVNGFDTVLERGQRYRVKVRDTSGETTRIGEFTPTVSETVQLTIDQINYETGQDLSGVNTSIRYVDGGEGEPDEIAVALDNIDSASVSIETEDGSTTLLDESYNSDFSTSVTVPEANESDVWVVDWEADVDDKTVSERQIVSSSQLQPGTDDIDSEWRGIFSMLGLIVLGGLFTRANAAVGALVIATLGGMLWMAGWMPAAASGATIAVAMLIGTLGYVIQKRRAIT
jgi:hypothetical protein